ncbi:hypothetical protein V6U89_08020 [Micromonospora sp. CPCC 206171]|uniref:hypothetical protein n=1 Tax=Micromonospora sp. CPCC 206171 TaxID=3122405 RepID=UPI002FF2C202
MTVAEDDSTPSARTMTRRMATSAILTILAGLSFAPIAWILLWTSPTADNPGYWDADFGRYIPDIRLWWWSATASYLLAFGFLVLSVRRRRAPGRWWIWPLSAGVLLVIAWTAILGMP